MTGPLNAAGCAVALAEARKSLHAREQARRTQEYQREAEREAADATERSAA